MPGFEEGDIRILHKLWYTTSFSRSKSLSIDNAIKGVPPHLKAEYKSHIDNLVKQNIIIKFPHKGGYKVYINPEYRNEIYKVLKKKFPFLR